jgi:hypothetical protein
MTNAVELRGCRRCNGDLFLDRDEDGDFLYCLQCGAIYTAPSPASSPAPAVEAPAVHSSTESPAAPSRSRSQRFISSRAGGAT